MRKWINKRVRAPWGVLIILASPVAWIIALAVVIISGR